MPNCPLCSAPPQPVESEDRKINILLSVSESLVRDADAPLEQLLGSDAARRARALVEQEDAKSG